MVFSTPWLQFIEWTKVPNSLSKKSKKISLKVTLVSEMKKVIAELIVEINVIRASFFVIQNNKVQVIIQTWNKIEPLTSYNG